MQECYLGLFLYDFYFVFGYELELTDEVIISLVHYFVFKKEYITILKKIFNISVKNSNIRISVDDLILDKAYFNMRKVMFSIHPNIYDEMNDFDKNMIFKLVCEYKKYIEMLEKIYNEKEGMRLWKN